VNDDINAVQAVEDARRLRKAEDDAHVWPEPEDDWDAREDAAEGDFDDDEA